MKIQMKKIQSQKFRKEQNTCYLANLFIFLTQELLIISS